LDHKTAAGNLGVGKRYGLIAGIGELENRIGGSLSGMDMEHDLRLLPFDPGVGRGGRQQQKQNQFSHAAPNRLSLMRSSKPSAF